MGKPGKSVGTAKLNSGSEIPRIGLGTWKATEGVGESVQTALKVGYRHIDCAAAYKNQDQVGKALQEVFQQGDVDRKDVWITSKLWNADHGRVEEACRQTLKELQLEYIDLYLMHWPVTGNEGPTVQPPIKDTWQHMEALVDHGLVKNIGVSNFTAKKLQDLLSYARIKPAVNQVELHPYFRNEKTHAFCTEKGIHVTAYSPLGSPDSASMQGRLEDSPKLMQDPVLQDIAKELGKHPAQVLIRWAVQNGTSVIPKASGESHIRSNLESADFELSQEHFKRLSSLQTQLRMVDGAMFLKEQGPYKTVRELWDGEVPADNPDTETAHAPKA